MRKFTKSLLALALLCVAGTASAENVETDLTAGMFKQWDATDGKALVTNDDATGVSSWGFDLNKELGAGGLVCGTGSVNGFVFADLSQYTTIKFTGTPTDGKSLNLRILYNRVGADGTTGETVIDITSGTGELDITALGLSYFHLNAIKVAWGENGGTVASIKLVKPADPYEVPKATLKTSIDRGKLQNSFAKTTDSWNALQDAISAGETEYANPTSTDALNDATLAIENAIAGLKLQAGYANVANSMFVQWDGYDANAKATGISTALVNNVGKSVNNGDVVFGFVYGQVYWNHYVDFTPFEKVYALGTVGKVARYVLNRPQDPENPTGEGTAAFIQKYIDVDGNGKAELDISNFCTENSTSYVHMNTFKAPNGGTFTDFIVYAAKSKAEVGAAGYATFSSIMNVDMTGVTAYAAKVNGATVALTPVAEVPANNAVIIEAAAGTYNLTNIESAAAIADNDLKISDGSVAGNGTIFVLAKKEKGVGFYKLANGEKVPAGKGYLVIDSNAPEFLGFGGDATGINEVKAVEAKGEFFNLAGQRVAKPAKGLYIANGKKVIIK